jgi:hypothetical protein
LIVGRIVDGAAAAADPLDVLAGDVFTGGKFIVDAPAGSGLAGARLAGVVFSRAWPAAA